MRDELCERFGYSRKYAITLRAKAGWGGDPVRRRGRPPLYGEEVAEDFVRLWKVAEKRYGKRLAALPEL